METPFASETGPQSVRSPQSVTSIALGACTSSTSVPCFLDPPYRPDSLSTHEEQIVAAIRQIIRAVDLHSRKLQRGHGLTGPQLAVLQHCDRPETHGDQPEITTPKSIAQAVHLSQATITGILHRLEKRGLILRTPSEEDKRSVFVQITPAGRQALQHSLSLLQDNFRTELAGLEEWERMQILSTLQRVARLMGSETLEAGRQIPPGEISAELPLIAD